MTAVGSWMSGYLMGSIVDWKIVVVADRLYCRTVELNYTAL